MAREAEQHDSPARLAGLDEIRGLAIALVMGFHIVPHFGFGWIGVQLFFVLSGFLITRSLNRSKEFSKSLQRHVITFYVRRALRIFPLYFAYLGILTSAVFLAPHAPIWGDATVIQNELPWAWTYTSNISRVLTGHQQTAYLTHFWSLSTEEQFYLLYPWILLLCPKGKERPFLALALVVGPIVRIGIAALAAGSPETFISPPMAVYFSGIAHVDAFATGALVNYLPIRRFGARATPLVMIATIAACSLASFALTGNWRGAAFWGFMAHGGQFVWGYTLLNLLAAWLIMGILTHGASRYFGVFSELLRKCGVVSYGMYLLHFPLYAVLLTMLQPFSAAARAMTAMLAVPLATYLLASLSFRYFESPLLRLKRYSPISG